MTRLILNGEETELAAEGDTPLLWVLRDELGLVGTKYGCGIGACGACTIHIDGQAARSCLTPLSAAAGKAVTTIEGLGRNGLHPVQQAWIDENVPQCGYCQAGQVMSAAALLAKTPDPSDREIDTAMAGNICRCGTYPRIQRAIRVAARNGGGE
jgi:isoquinoline 1-oxidoreductase alpha subunit